MSLHIRITARFFAVAIAAAVTFALTIGSAPAPAWAQAPAGDLTAEQKEEVGRLLLEAKRAYSSKDYDLALDRLVKAYDMYPDPNIQRRIGEALERLRRDREALEVYQRVLARDDLESQTRDAVERRVNFLEDLFRSRQAVVSVSSPELETQIWIDGEETPRGTVPLELRLDPGTYTLRAELEGKDALTYEVKLGEREKASWRAEWEVEEEVADLPPPPDELPESDYSIVGWTSVGVGAVMFGAAITTLVMASSRASTLDDYDALRDQARPADYSDVESEYNTLVTLSWVGAGLGTLFTGIGTYLLISSTENVEPTNSAVTISPVRGGAHVGWRLNW